MALLENYHEVHSGFRQLSGELNGARLDLEIVCPGSWDSQNPPDSFRSDDVIGKIRVPLNEDLSKFSTWAQPIQIDSLGVQPTQISAFVELCRSAGALLPSIRKGELRSYYDWDSRRFEELWVANLLHLTKKYSQARLNIDVIHILKPIEFSLDVINACMDDGLIPNESPTPTVVKAEKKPGERADLQVLQDLADQHYRELWRIPTAAEWGRFLIPGREKTIDPRTVRKLETWERAEQRRKRSGQMRGRLMQLGVSQERLEEFEDSSVIDFQKLIDEQLDKERYCPMPCRKFR